MFLMCPKKMSEILFQRYAGKPCPDTSSSLCQVIISAGTAFFGACLVLALCNPSVAEQHTQLACNTYLGSPVVEPGIEFVNDRPVLLDSLQADLVGPPDAEVHPVEKGRDPREGEQGGGGTRRGGG